MHGASAEAHHKIWHDEHRTLAAAERVGRILTHLGVSLPDEALAELVSSFEEGLLEHPPVLVAGAREALERLSERYRLGIISDVGFSPGRVLKYVLEQAGYHAIRFTGVTPMLEDETTIADFVTADLTDVPRLVGMIDQSIVRGP